MPPKKSLEPEWSFPVEAEKIGSSSAQFKIRPSVEARKALARRLDIVSLESLEAELSFVRHPGQAAIHVTGSFEASVVQECVVTAKPVPGRIAEKFEAWYADKDKTISLAAARHELAQKKSAGEAPILDESDDPEPLIEGKIDAGELVTQYLSLSLNPYPHAEGVLFEVGDDQPEARARVDNPFAALKDWKTGKGKE